MIMVSSCIQTQFRLPHAKKGVPLAASHVGYPTCFASGRCEAQAAALLPSTLMHFSYNLLELKSPPSGR